MYQVNYEVTIEGLSPLNLEKYALGTISNGKGIRDVTKKNFKEDWVKKTYLNDEGYVIYPATNIQCCMLNGGKKLKKGKSSYASYVFPYLMLMPFEPCVKVNEKMITIDDIREKGWTNVYRGVTTTGVSHDGERTCLPVGWTIDFQIINTCEDLSEEEIKGVLEKAGLVAGIGGQRPSSPRKPGSFGRFQVTKFEEV